jgi:hypothetical protein
MACAKMVDILPRWFKNATNLDPTASKSVGSGGGAGTPGGSEKRPDGGPDGDTEIRSTGGAGG